MRVKPKVKGGASPWSSGRRGLEEVVKGTDFEGLDLLPAEFSMRNMDLMLEDQKGPTKRLLRLLRPQSDSWDRVVLDCPPSISLVSENVFRAADALLVPMVPTTLFARTLELLLDSWRSSLSAGISRSCPSSPWSTQPYRCRPGLWSG